MPVISAFDCASSTGVASGDISGTPSMETWKLNHTPGNNGPATLDMLQRLNDHFDRVQPVRVYCEKPFINPQRPNLNSVGIIISLVTAVQIVCYQRGVKVVLYENNKWKKDVTGKGMFSKDLVPYPPEEFCKDQGWPVETNDEADAACIWAYAIMKEADPKYSERLMGLFKGL